MSFTQDELQSFNTILEQKLSIQRRELERSLDQRMSMLKRDLEQYLGSLQQDLLRNIPLRLFEQQNKLKDTLNQQLEAQEARVVEVVSQELEQFQQQQSLDAVIERALAAQLLAIEQLINQRSGAHLVGQSQVYASDERLDGDVAEMPAEISWEDLVDVIDRAVGERLSSLETSIQTTVRNAEHYLLTQLRGLRNDMVLARQTSNGSSANSNITNIQDVFTSIEQLERIIESMQVAMTANHALLSNRLYHHQSVSLERAHHATQPLNMDTTHNNENDGQVPTAKEPEID